MSLVLSAPRLAMPCPIPAAQPVELRRVLGSFATGVTIVTTRGEDGAPAGLTANSFSSVSLDPPLVLWSLARSSRLLPVFRAARHWAVHVLGEHQRALSDRFCARDGDRFAGLETDEGLAGVPLLPDCAAVLQCATATCHDGGDHLILIGEVLASERRDVPPLVFHGGRYVRLAEPA
jgi:flavin reductase (DIM6/NTAB) family NADH-FMN oxidoreductase RutF